MFPAPKLKDELIAAYFLIVFCVVNLGPVGCVVVTGFLLYKGLWYLPVLYLVWYCYDFGIEDRGGWNRLWYHTKLKMSFYSYFPLKLVKTCDLSPERNYVVGSHPHGFGAFGARGAFEGDLAAFAENYPGISPRLCVHRWVFRIPFCREFALASGCVSASRGSLEFMLRQPSKGKACAIIVGGARESVEECRTHIALILNNRKGFVKMAIKTGSDLVPAFTFGENLLFKQTPAQSGSLISCIQKWQLSKAMIPLRTARGKFWFAPLKVPLTIVVGRPIQVTQKDHPRQEEVDQLHGQYVEALKSLYEEYNPIYGDSKVPLVIK